MSHRHFCDYEGHFWECEGAAVRQFAENSERTPCICITHSASMEDGDHSECPVELLACPEHRQQQLRQLSEFNTSEEGAANARISGQPLPYADQTRLRGLFRGSIKDR
jgi:hypothetical protein